jgi:hypothetical protein
MGASDLNEADFVTSYLDAEGLYDARSHSLTMKGWMHYEELKQSVDLPMRGFMAMKYGDQMLDRVFKQCWYKAAFRAGFELIRVDEEPRAGLIDDQIRLDIRRSRFVIADLSGHSEGAYWEAGYAEALGKPVIYTCRHGHQSKVHFDTNHHLTVAWDADSLETAENKLVATIRASLPEAQQEDQK